MVFTDEYQPYVGLQGRFQHRRIAHKQRIYVEGNTHTQTVEGFFGLFKNGVRGVYHAISTRYVQDYLNEYTFRYNRRDGREPMFWAMLGRVEQRRLAARPLGSSSPGRGRAGSRPRCAPGPFPSLHPGSASQVPFSEVAFSQAYP
jgi:hypothetical protein